MTPASRNQLYETIAATPTGDARMSTGLDVVGGQDGRFFGRARATSSPDGASGPLLTILPAVGLLVIKDILPRRLSATGERTNQNKPTLTHQPKEPRMATEVTIDPEFHALIPPLTEAELEQLEKNLLADGCRDSLVTSRGILLDGHNRLAICEKHSIAYETMSVELPDRNAAMAWVIRNQFGRRNLTLYVRAKLALKLKPLIKAKAKRKQAEGGRKKVCQTSDKPIDAKKELAKAAGVSHDTIAKVEYIEGHADEDTKEALRQSETTVNRAYTATKRAKKKAANEALKAKSPPLPKGQHDVVVMDPPWPMDKILRDCSPDQAAIDYPTMTEGELAAIDVPAAVDCHLFLWTTQRFLPMALRLLAHWGFKYVLTMVWHKPGGFQPFGLPQYNCEFILYGRKGTPTFIDTKAFPVCFTAPRGKHSEKPAKFYETIARVTSGKRIDMFSRRKIAGFKPWGNE